MIDEIYNVRRIDERLLTAGQPNAEQLRELAAAGCTALINLSTNDPRWALPGEAELALELGMDYRHLPVVFDAPSPQDYAAFAAALDGFAGRSVLVHCVANYRVSAFMAIYGERTLGWDRARADAWIADVWQPDPIWAAFIAGMRES